MELVRKAAMVVGTLALALGIGYGVQNGAALPESGLTTADAGRMINTDVVSPTSLDHSAVEMPKDIVPLAAGFEPEPVFPPALTDSAQLPTAAFAPPAVENLNNGTAANLGPSTPALAGDGTDCTVTFDVIASAEATLDLTLIAPCRASERVVLRHGGLAVTGMTSATGTLFASLPGMEASGEVSVLFASGQEVTAAEALPNLPGYRRFAVQWMADDAFQINAFENGAGFGTEGHVSAANPQRRLPNVPLRGGYLTTLGDSSVPFPMLAEVYTFPADKTAPVDLTLEAKVTDATCNRELLGEMLLSEAGTVTKTDLSMATPTCDGIGDVLVLNNPLPDLKLAAAN